jgi:hypothetical protein
MAITVYPADAVAGAPVYSGQMLRKTLGVLIGGATAVRPLGGRSGIRPGTGAVGSSTTTTWTMNPHAGALDLESSASAGTYYYAVDAAVSGSLTAPHATLARKDILYITLNDPAEQDGSAKPDAVPGYLAGTAASNPAPPSPPARSLVVSTLTVPPAGSGTPTAVNGQYTNAAGADTLLNSVAELNALPTHEGKRAFCLYDGAQALYSGGRWLFNDTRQQSYTVAWTDIGGTNLSPGSGGYVTGAYWRRWGSVRLRVVVAFGSAGINTGGGAFRFSIPINAAAGYVADISCRAWVPGLPGSAHVSGFADIQSNKLIPYLPYNNGGAGLGQAQNASGVGVTGSGTPYVAGQPYTWVDGTTGNIVMDGEYNI